MTMVRFPLDNAMKSAVVIIHIVPYIGVGSCSYGGDVLQYLRCTIRVFFCNGYLNKY